MHILLLLAVLCAVSASSRAITADATAQGITATLSAKALTSEWSVVVPDDGNVSARMTVHRWKAGRPAEMDTLGKGAFGVTIVRTGRYGNHAMATLAVQPWRRNGDGWQRADSATVHVAFERNLVRSAKTWTLPAWADPLLNPGWEEREVSAAKRTDAIQRGIDPSWIDPSRPHVKLMTSHDGIARSTGTTILAVEPALAGAPLATLTLFQKGIERHIFIIDGDGSGTLTASDTIFFRGRRPEGDTIWYNVHDTVSTFFLTTRPGEHLRMTELTGCTGQTTRLPALDVDLHIERDDGFYHLGSGIDEVSSTYLTDDAYLEGFYWDALNAKAFERLTFRYPVTGTGQPDDSIRFSLHYAASTNAWNYSPDNRMDFSVDGEASAQTITDGFGMNVVSVTLPGNRIASGATSMRAFSVGNPEFFTKEDYVSELLVDYVTIEGKALPYLMDGSFIGRTSGGGQDAPWSVPVDGSRTRDIYVLDTTLNRLARHVVSVKGNAIRASITKVDREWTTTDWNGTKYRASVIINDEMISIDSTSGFFAIVRQPSSTTSFTTVSTDAETLLTALRALPQGSTVVVGGCGSQASVSLKSWISEQGATPSSETVWLHGFVLGASSTLSADAGSRPVVAVDGFLEHDQGQRYSGVVCVPSDRALGLYINDDLAVEVAVVRASALADLRAPHAQADVIYVAHGVHRANAERLAAHRRNHNGVSTAVVDIDAILDEFGAGSRAPEALREFLRHAWETWPEPRPSYAVLVGNATWDQRVIIKEGNVGARRPDQVPTYGRPSSDYWFGLLEGGDYAFPEMVVSRLPVLTEEESSTLVDKIVQSDTVQFSPWMRRFMFVGGGDENEGMCQVFYDMLQDPFGTGDTFTEVPMCMDSVTLCKYTAPANVGFLITQQLNTGVQWMNYIGHGATQQFDITGWEPSELSNTGRYGILATYACQTGAYSNPSTLCKNGQYLVEPGKGFVAAVGGTGWEFKIAVSMLHYNIHQQIRDARIRGVGDLIYAAKQSFARRGDREGYNTVMQYCVLGDPFTRIRMDTIPDVYARRQDLVIADRTNDLQITEDDSIAVVSLTVHNAGMGTTLPLLVRCIRTFEAYADTTEMMIDNGICGSAVLRCSLDIAGMTGEHNLVFDLDPTGVFSDENRANNRLTAVMTVFSRSVLPVEPQRWWDMPIMNPVFRVLDPQSTDTKTLDVEFAITTAVDTIDATTVMRSQPSEITRTGSVVDWSPTLILEPDRQYWMSARLVDRVNGTTSSRIWIPFGASGRTGLGQDEQRLRQHGSGLRPATAGAVAYDDDRKGYVLGSRELELFVRSSGVGVGNPDSVQIVRTFQVRLDGIYYRDNNYLRGLNIVVFGPYDTIPRAIRWYDTWQFPQPPEAGHNGSTREFLTFMRDSIGADDRVVVAACDEAFSGFVKDGNIDTLRETLRMYGSMYEDSLRNNSSYVLVGRRGLGRGAAVEGWKGAPDSMVKITTKLPFYRRNGFVESDWFGPVKRIASIQVGGDGMAGGMRTVLYGRRRDGSVDSLASFEDGTGTWNDVGSGTDYLAVQTRTELTHVADSQREPVLRSVDAVVVPADEWSIERGAVTVPTEEVLRGDTVGVTYLVRNVMRSYASSQSAVTLVASGATVGEHPVDVTMSLPAMAANTTFDTTIAIPTAALGERSTISATVNEGNIHPELYAYNNTSAIVLTIGEDDVPPTITVMADQRIVRDGDFILTEPLVEVLLSDNSQLPINDSTRLTAYVNGDRIRPAVTTDFQFLSTQNVYGRYAVPDVRAAQIFRYRMDKGQNNLLVRAKDATGNEAHLDMALWVSDKTQLLDALAAPNPSSGPVTFAVRLASPVASTPARVDISDVQGRMIRQLPVQLTIGTASVVWDGRGADGQSLPTGTYFYRISLTGDPSLYRTGMLVLLR